jgi:hypothetical protein
MFDMLQYDAVLFVYEIVRHHIPDVYNILPHLLQAEVFVAKYFKTIFNLYGYETGS